MPKLKDYLDADLDVFMSTDEFAEEHNIDGRNLRIVVNNDRLKERSKVEYDGIMVGEILYFVKASDYGKAPMQGMVQVFDRRYMQVFDVRLDDGMYEIILQSNQTS